MRFRQYPQEARPSVRVVQLNSALHERALGEIALKIIVAHATELVRIRRTGATVSACLWRWADEIFQRSMNPGGSSGLVETSSSIEASFEVPMMPL